LPRRLILKPNFDPSGAAVNISATLTLPSPALRASDALFAIGRIAGQDDISVNLASLDDAGDLVLHVDQAGDGKQHFCVSRDTAGDVTLRFNINPVTSFGEQVADVQPGLRRDQGGLVGVGSSFLPQPFATRPRYGNIVEWDLSGAPSGTRAIWSFGEGPEPILKDGPASVLLNSIYMVGPVKSYPERPTAGLDTGSLSSCGTYWLGELPPNLAAVKDFTSKIFPRMAAHFRDEGGSYRLVLRKVPSGFAGLTCMSSSIVDYDNDTKDELDWDLVRLLNHHMVRSWVNLDSEADGYSNDWFSRGSKQSLAPQFITVITKKHAGWAQIYSVFLPFRFGQRSPDYFKATINAFCTAYYTNPLKGTSLRDTNKISLDWYARTIPDMRGCIYMLKMDFLTRRAARARGEDVMRPIDDIVAEISVRRRLGESVQTKDWLQYLGHWFDEEAAKTHFENFMDGVGETLELGDLTSSFGASHAPVAVEQDVLDLGMDARSFVTKVVSGVVPGSRAELAGVENGDRILWHSRLGACVTNLEKKVRLTVERDGKKIELEYWPRGWTKAPSWQVMRIAGDD